MSTAPAADQTRLLDVQALDTLDDQLVHRRATLPELARLTEVTSRHQDLATALVAARTAAGDLSRELAKAEADVEQVRARAVRDQARLDSGAVSLKDVQALTSELEHLAGRQSDLEEVQLEVMERLEAQTEALAREQEAFDLVDRDLNEARAAAQAATAAVDAERSEVATRRLTAVAGLDAGLLALYERLRTGHGGVGVGRLVGRRCDGCRMELNPLDLESIGAAPPDQVVRCEECGRILVRV